MCHRGHKRMKQPFPEVTSSTRNRRSQSGLSKIKQIPAENPRNGAKNKEGSRFQEATNTRHVRGSSRTTDPTENLTRPRQSLSSIAHDSSTHQDHQELSLVQQNNEIVTSTVLNAGMTISDSDGEKQPGANTTSTRIAAEDLGIQVASGCLPNTRHITSEKGVHPGAHEVHARAHAQLPNIQHMSDLPNFRDPQYSAVTNGGQNDAGDRIDGAQAQRLEPLSISTIGNDARCERQEQNAEVGLFIQSTFHQVCEQDHLPGGSPSMHPQNHDVGAHIQTSPHSHQGDHPEGQTASQVPPRVPSRTESEAHSRPQSRRSNHGISMTRPFSSHDLHPPGASSPAALHLNHATKVKKSGRAQNQVLSIAPSSSPVSKGKRQPEERSGSSRRFRDILNTLSEYDNMIQNFEQQKLQMDLQRKEIIKLKDSQERIEALEKEKESLTKKVKKLEELSSKYKKHMNEVVTAQKFLKTEATNIMETSTKALELYASNGVYAGRAQGETVAQKLKCAIEESKGLRVAVEKSASGKYYSFQLS
jgi:hypothetical protein